MAAIGRFQKGDEIFHAKVVDGEIFRLRGDVFGSPSFERKPMKLRGVHTLTPVVPTKVIAVGLNYADHARESGKPLPKQPLFWFKATTSTAFFSLIEWTRRPRSSSARNWKRSKLKPRRRSRSDPVRHV